ncbi:MAG: MarR family transcriptional regulator [Chloroflexus aggregans]|uniref:MarR family transcriptional regulator n=1 Tax=Chloroflexus aggregans TaxID=152260 RepID=A0A2J6X0W7_9CHLR|nr:MAG: MarR family transcriptional regulator [Chloroflexus aggregans]
MSPFDPSHRRTPTERSVIALYRIAHAIEVLLRQRGKAVRLTTTQIDTLLFLKYARPGVRTVGGLAQRLGVSYATASVVVDGLERRELVARHGLQNDLRVVRLRLTEKGEAQLAEIEGALDGLQAALTELTPNEQAYLDSMLRTVVRSLQRIGAVHVYEMCWGCQFFRAYAHPDNPAAPHHCAFVDAPLADNETRFECPDFVPMPERR